MPRERWEVSLAPPPASTLDVFPASKVRIITVIYLLRK